METLYAPYASTNAVHADPGAIPFVVLYAPAFGFSFDGEACGGVWFDWPISLCLPVFASMSGKSWIDSRPAGTRAEKLVNTFVSLTVASSANRSTKVSRTMNPVDQRAVVAFREPWTSRPFNSEIARLQ